MDTDIITTFVWLFVKDLKNASTYAALIFLFIVSLYFLYNCLRYSIYIKSECWWCMNKTPVIYANRNNWTCVHCEQYNGFTSAGDYNCEIEQHSEDNGLFYCYPKYKLKYETNRLCDSCNQNQERKYKILSEFSPVNDDNYSVELRLLKKNLDDIYSLCFDCERLVQYLELDCSNKTPFSPRFIHDSSAASSTSSTSDNHQSNADIFDKKIKSNSIRIRLGRMVRLVFLLTFHVVILRILYELYIRSETAFLFKNNQFVDLKFQDKTYKHFYLPSIISLQILFLIMVYFKFSRLLILNWTVFGLFFALLCFDFDMNLFRFKNDQLVHYQQTVFVLYSAVIFMNIFAGTLIWLKNNFFLLKRIFTSASEPVRFEQRSFDNNDVEMEDLDENCSEQRQTKTYSNKIQFNSKSRTFWATQIQSKGDYQILNHFGYTQTQSMPISSVSTFSNFSYKNILILFIISLLSICTSVLFVYLFKHITVNFSNDSDLFELNFRFSKSY